MRGIDELSKGPEPVWADLLSRCTAGEAAAWSRLLAEARRLTQAVVRGGFRLGQEDAEDVAQIVQIRVAERLLQVRQPESFPGWVCSLARRAAIDHLRARKPVISLDDPATFLPEAEVNAAADYEQVLLRVDLERALQRLPALYQEPIRLYLLEGLPQDEVGRLLGRPRSTIASQVERGLDRLQRALISALPAG